METLVYWTIILGFALSGFCYFLELISYFMNRDNPNELSRYNTRSLLSRLIGLTVTSFTVASGLVLLGLNAIIYAFQNPELQDWVRPPLAMVGLLIMVFAVFTFYRARKEL